MSETKGALELLEEIGSRGLSDLDFYALHAAILAERQRHAEEVARLEERCQSREEQLGKLSELYDVTQKRLEDFEEREPDARLCAEWAATVALKATDVYSAARRYLCGESRGIVAQVQKENDSLRDQLRRVEGERDEAQRQCGELHEHLALMVRYLEEETSEGDGIAEQHWDGYQGAKSVLMRTAPNRAAWETRMVEFAELQKVASHVPGLSAALDEARHELTARRAHDADVRACAEAIAAPARKMAEELARNYSRFPPVPMSPLEQRAMRLLAADFLREPCPECHMVERCKMSCSRGGSKGARLSVSLRKGEE